MAKKIKRIIFFLLVFPLYVDSQQEIYVKKNMLKATATLCPSKMFAKNFSPFYLHGFAEYFAEDNVSVAGEGFYYLGDFSNKKSIIEYHHSIFFGTNYHILNKNHDLFMGMEPGISLTKLKPAPGGKTDGKPFVNPLFSMNVRYNYYVWKYFHFFIQTKIVAGENINYHPFNLSDIRFSAGLGFQL
jgi:hypothetical protein